MLNHSVSEFMGKEVVMLQVGTKRTITKMLWAFPEPLLLTRSMEEVGVEPDQCPRIWKIEVEIDSMPGDDRRYTAQCEVKFYAVLGDTDPEPLCSYLYHNVPGGMGELDARREIYDRFFTATFKGRRNQQNTITARDFCKKLFARLGLQVDTFPEVYQLTRIVESIDSSEQVKWITFGEDLWSDDKKPEVSRETVHADV
jgi:hypothetical protein